MNFELEHHKNNINEQTGLNTNRHKKCAGTKDNHLKIANYALYYVRIKIIMSCVRHKQNIRAGIGIACAT